jgi:hypothetical protein
MRSITCASLLLAAAAALAPCVAHAEDATPADAGRKALAALAAPSDKHTYSTEVDLFVAGNLFGGGSFAAAPETVGDKALWRTTENVRIGSEATPQMTMSIRGLAGADLHIVEEIREEKGPQGTETTKTTRTEKGLHVSHTQGASSEEKDVEAAADTVSGGLPNLLLFLRQIPADAAEYEVAMWDGDDRAVEKRRVSMKGAGRMKDESIGFDVEALWAVAASEKESIEIYVDPKDRALLGIHSVRQGLWITKKGLVKPKDVGAAPDLTKPAESAKGAGAKFALGILTGNAAAVEASIHWPSWAAESAAQGQPMDEAMLKSFVMAAMQQGMQKFEVPMAWGIVKGAVDGAQEKALEGGAVKVTLGAPMNTVKYKAKQVEGLGWLITSMEQPGAGGDDK